MEEVVVRALITICLCAIIFLPAASLGIEQEKILPLIEASCIESENLAVDITFFFRSGFQGGAVTFFTTKALESHEFHDFFMTLRVLWRARQFQNELIPLLPKLLLPPFPS